MEIVQKLNVYDINLAKGADNLKKTILLMTVICLLGLIIPALITDEWGQYKNSLHKKADLMQDQSTFDQKTKVKVYFTDTQEIKEMSLREYLIAVVAGEMPVTFHEEALKAQATAARSYTLNKMANAADTGETGPHFGADVCTDYHDCGAFLSKAEAKRNWGEARFVDYWTKIEKAVTETDGEVVCYLNEPICAVFHSTSSGKTEDAKNIWGSDVAYLKEVESPGEENSPRYQSLLRVEKKIFEEKMKELSPQIILPAEAQNWIEAPQKSESGTVLQITIGDQTFTGVQLRNLFDLRSAVFDITYEGEEFVFSVTGYGHGVGLSQYGAQYMAQQGKPYQEILLWYYTNTQLQNLNEGL